MPSAAHACEKGRLRGSSLALLFSLAAWSSGASAQAPPRDSGPTDWAVSLPSCAFGESPYGAGSLRLLYPRPGLPAVVEQGAALVARIRMPSALTPPPGHQQDKALRGFDAQLIASGGVSFGGARSVYELRVADVRPDAGSSLVYRLRLPLPRWIAPGTYSLRVRAPSSGGRVSVASVRVVAAGNAPRLVALGPGPEAGVDALRERLRGLEGYPADVIVLPRTPRLQVALNATLGSATWPPVLLSSGPHRSGLLRAGDQLLDLGDCATTRGRRRAPGAGETQRVELARAELPRDAALERYWSARERGEPVLRRSRDGDARSVTAARWLTRPAELSLLVPEDGWATRLRGAEDVRWWPGASLFATTGSPSLVARVEVAAGQAVVVTRAPAAPLSLRLVASPARAVTDQEVTLRGELGRPGRIAWRLAEDVTAVGGEVRHRWALRDAVEVHALAIDAQGVSARASLSLPVDTRREGACSLGVPGRGLGGRSGAIVIVLFAVLWTFRRRRHTMRRLRE